MLCCGIDRDTAGWVGCGSGWRAELLITVGRGTNRELEQAALEEVPVWFSHSSAALTLQAYADFESNMLSSAVSGRSVDAVSAMPAVLASDRIEAHYSGLTSKHLASELERSGLEYLEPTVEVEITAVSNDPPELATEDQTQAWSNRGEGVYVQFTRVATLPIDLTGATQIQGFDPADGISTVSSDDFLAVFIDDGDGSQALDDITWLAPHDKALADRPIGWLGSNALITNQDDQSPPRWQTAVGSGDDRGDQDAQNEFSSAPTATSDQADEAAQASFQIYLTDAQKQDVVDYARQYAIDENEDFKVFGNDCTNFISQALHAGGWETISRSGLRTTIQDDPDIWFYRHMTWIYPESTEWATWTWTGVDEWYNFARNESGRTSSRGNIWWYVPGEILQANIDGLGDIDHSMVVTGKWTDANGSTQIVLSYHTNNRLDKSIRDLLDVWPDAGWYGHET